MTYSNCAERQILIRLFLTPGDKSCVGVERGDKSGVGMVHQIIS